MVELIWRTDSSEMILSHCRACSMLCVTTKIVLPNWSLKVPNQIECFWDISGSNDPVGSSARTISPGFKIALTIAILCCSPSLIIHWFYYLTDFVDQQIPSVSLDSLLLLLSREIRKSHGKHQVIFHTRCRNECIGLKKIVDDIPSVMNCWLRNLP